uniref:CD36 family protein n=1 Tax=Parascaris univalens TaxID=6257 RepID=A0A915AC97_PARUN
RHIPFVFAHEPISGMLTRAQVRLMASVPIFRNLETTTLSMCWCPFFGLTQT